jgi:hypothetical protein
MSEDEEPQAPTSFDHYALVDNTLDVQGRKFRNLADWVIMELWVSLSHYDPEFIAFIRHY